MKSRAFKPKISLIDSFIIRDVFRPVHESLIIHSVLLFFQSLVHRAPQETNSAVPDSVGFVRSCVCVVSKQKIKIKPC